MQQLSGEEQGDASRHGLWSGLQNYQSWTCNRVKPAELHGVKRADGALKRPPLKGVVIKLLFERHRAISKSHFQAPIQLPLLQTAPVSTRPCWSPSSRADSFWIVDGHHPAGTRATPWPAIGFSIPNCVGKKPGHVWSLKFDWLSTSCLLS